MASAVATHVAPLLFRRSFRVFAASFRDFQPVLPAVRLRRSSARWSHVVRCVKHVSIGGSVWRTCKNCKKQYDPSLNHPRSCRFHTAHFGGETKRKFESVYTGGTMDTPDSGRVFQYWHCCGSEDPFDPGCTAAPHLSYDD